MEALDFAVLRGRVRLSRAEKMIFMAKARFRRLTEDNVLEKRDRDRRRAGGAGGRRRAGWSGLARAAVRAAAGSREPRNLLRVRGRPARGTMSARVIRP